MHPVLFHVGDIGVGSHEVFLVLGVAVALGWFALELRHRGLRGDDRWWILAAAAIGGGALFAKVSTAWRYLADDPDPTFTGLLLYGGKSLLGGLVGAYVGVLVAKRAIRFNVKTGDVFTPAAILGIAIGRIGCFLAEPPGTPTGTWFGVTLGPQTVARIPGCERCVPNVPLHPTFLYEIAFLLALFVFLRWIGRRMAVPGETFKLFLLWYGLFRFGVESLRLNPRFALGLSGSQLFLLVTLPFLLAYFARQILRHAYRRAGPLVAPRALVHGRT